MTEIIDFRDRLYTSQSARLNDGTCYPVVTFQYGDRRMTFDPAASEELLYALELSAP